MNNQEGWADLDSSRCFIGAVRFDSMLTQLPAGASVVRIDGHTAIVIDPAPGEA